MYPSLFIFVLGSFSFFFVFRDSRTLSLPAQIERIKNIDDVVLFMKKIASTSSTEYVTEELVCALTKTNLSENTLLRLSNLHKTFATDNGIRGYAINMLWSCVILAH